MSFQPILTAYNLTFTQYPGLHVKMHGSTLGELMAQDMPVDPNNITPEEKMRSFNFLEEKLISWDVEHPELRRAKDGTTPEFCPACGLRAKDHVPETLKGIFCLDPDFILSIITGYIEMVGKPSPKVSAPSMHGATPETLRRLAERQNPLKSQKPN